MELIKPIELVTVYIDEWGNEEYYDPGNQMEFKRWRSDWDWGGKRLVYNIDKTWQYTTYPGLLSSARDRLLIKDRNTLIRSGISAEKILIIKELTGCIDVDILICTTMISLFPPLVAPIVYKDMSLDLLLDLKFNDWKLIKQTNSSNYYEGLSIDNICVIVRQHRHQPNTYQVIPSCDFDISERDSLVWSSIAPGIFCRVMETYIKNNVIQEQPRAD